MADLNIIRQHILNNGIDYCHYTLAQLIHRSIPDASEMCLWLAVLVNLEIDKANVCLAVESIEEKSKACGWRDIPGLDELQDIIANCPVIGRPGDVRPLIADNDKLYLHRYFHYETGISQHLLARTGQPQPVLEEQARFLDSLFPAEPVDHGIDMQKIAAIVCSLHPLAIISGGPGTGKTYTVSKVLAIMSQQQPDIRIQLAAPTGKAAMRLSQSIASLGQLLELDDSLQQRIPQQALTLHRLLGLDRYSHRPRYHRANPLDCDLLVVDEASMIDQQMMAMLCDALTADARLILLGDKDQLASVEAGSVFADLCGGLQSTAFNPAQRHLVAQAWQYELQLNQSTHALADQLVVLDKSHRFDASSAIGSLASCINRGQSQQCLQIMGNQDSRVSWSQIEDALLVTALQQQADSIYWQMIEAADIDQAFALFHQFQILCAVWSGPAGVHNINAIIEQHLKQRSGIDNMLQYYQGKPLMVTRNVYEYDLFNGDIGIIWPDQDEELKIWFETGHADYRVLSLSQLPQHEIAYAMTVHKSQGSEFEHVLMLFPSEDVEVLTRELFYTAITRAAESLEIWGQADIITQTIERQTQRVSGLMQRLQVSSNTSGD